MKFANVSNIYGVLIEMVRMIYIDLYLVLELCSSANEKDVEREERKQ